MVGLTDLGSKETVLCLLTLRVTWVMMSCAVVCLAVAFSVREMRGGMMWGDLLVFSQKLEKLVYAFMVFMMTNHMQGSLANHPFWLLST